MMHTCPECGGDLDVFDECLECTECGNRYDTDSTYEDYVLLDPEEIEEEDEYDY